MQDDVIKRKAEALAGRGPELVKVRRRQDRATQTRQAILDAAKLEFSANGFGGATTRAIADRASVRHALLIYHFETKLGVWQAMMEQFLQAWRAELLAAVEPLAASDAVAALRAFQRTFIEMSAKDPDAHWLMSEAAREPSDRTSILIAGLIGTDIDFFIGLIARVQAMGHYIAGDPRHLYYLFIGAASRVFMLKAEVKRNTGASPYDSQFVEQHVRACEALLFRNLPGLLTP